MDINKLTRYENKWVALSKDRKTVLAAASDLKELDKKVDKLGKQEVIYHHVLPFKGTFSP